MAQGELEARLERWREAGLIDETTAAAIRAHEAAHGAPAGLRWPVAIVIGLGGLMLGAGVLLFVAAHWSGLSPGGRTGVVAAALAGLHLAGAAAPSAALRTTLHAVGTVALGAGIYLVAQVFHLEAHWPDGVGLWALGALAGVLVLGDWPQAALLAVLGPAWLVAEWSVERWWLWDAMLPTTGLVLLAVAYLGADAGGARTPVRRALGILGALALLPLGAILGVEDDRVVVDGATALPWAVAIGLPLAVAAWSGGATVAAVAAMALWIALGPRGPAGDWWSDVTLYLWFALAALGIVVWGFRRGAPRAINVGVAGFALTVGVFYFSSVMDKLGRSASLVGLGVLFLGGGSLLERARRHLVAGASRPPGGEPA